VPNFPKKICTKCKEEKEIHLFANNPTTKDGKRHDCRECVKVYHHHYYHHYGASKRPTLEKRQAAWRKWRYGVDNSEYAKLLDSSGGACQICGEITTLCVDHQQEPFKVRGLLCGKCNKGIGLLGHDVGILRSAIAYLRGKK
jgi:hypothetical protein